MAQHFSCHINDIPKKYFHHILSASSKNFLYEELSFNSFGNVSANFPLGFETTILLLWTFATFSINRSNRKVSFFGCDPSTFN